MSSPPSAIVQYLKQNLTPSAPTDVDVGTRLRQHREVVGWSQRELARRSGLTNGMISQIEQNHVSPSVASLRKLTDALSLTLADFFSESSARPAGPFFSKGELTEIGTGEVSLRLVPAGVANAQLEVLHEHYPPRSDTGPDMLSHGGEEAGVVVRGSITVTVGSLERRLSAGESYYFDSRVPHRFRNESAEPCELVSSATPRSF